MGVYLSTPCTDIDSESGEGYGLRYCAGEIQGWRKTMEDAHISSLNIANTQARPVSIFGVFDGHGGKEVAKFCQLYFNGELSRTPEFAAGNYGDALKKCFHRMDEMLEDEAYDYQLQQFRKLPNPCDRSSSRTQSTESEGNPANKGTLNISCPLLPGIGRKIPISEAVELFQQLLVREAENKKLEAQLAPNPVTNTETTPPAEPVEVEPTYHSTNGYPVCQLKNHRIMAGCTAVVVVLADNKLYVANAGDSRAVLCQGDGTAKALSIDHKPAEDSERDRITAAGGFVNEVGRVNGNLNLSRAIGDLKYKQNKSIPRADQIISGEPDVTVTPYGADDKFVIIACDGVWDCFTNQEAVDFVRERLEQNKSLLQILEDWNFKLSCVYCSNGVQMFKHCVSVDPRRTQGIGGDNMTCIIVELNK